MGDILGVVDVWGVVVVDFGMGDVGGVVVDIDDYCLVLFVVFCVIVYGCRGWFFEEIDLVEIGLVGGFV